MNEKMNSYLKRIKIISILYLSIPILIFLVCWLRYWLAGMLGILFVYGVYNYIKSELELDVNEVDERVDERIQEGHATGKRKSARKEEISVEQKNNNFSVLIFYVLLLSAGWTLISGIGGYSFQNWDFHFRNAVLHDLIDFSWPVVYQDHTVLTYNLTYWLPSAIAGKIFGWDTANFIMFIWSWGGLILIFSLLLYRTKTFLIWPIIVFIFFSGMDILGIIINTGQFPSLGTHLEWWSINQIQIQYSSFTTQLFWVFHQAIPAWLITILLLNEPKRTNLLPLFALCIPYAPFATIGLLPFVIYFFFRNKDKSDDKEVNKNYKLSYFVKTLRAGIKLHSLLIPLILFVVFGGFYMINDGTQSDNGFILSNNNIELVLPYLLFCLLEFGIICVFLFPKFRKEGLFILTVIILLCVPLYRSGFSNDFCMRVSIPALIILCVYSVEYLSKVKKRLYFYAFTAVLAIGAITPVYEGSRAIINLLNGQELVTDAVKTFSNHATRPTDGATIHIQNFISKEYPSGYFPQYLQKNK